MLNNLPHEMHAVRLGGGRGCRQCHSLYLVRLVHTVKQQSSVFCSLRGSAVPPPPPDASCLLCLCGCPPPFATGACPTGGPILHPREDGDVILAVRRRLVQDTAASRCLYVDANPQLDRPGDATVYYYMLCSLVASRLLFLWQTGSADVVAYRVASPGAV